MNRQTLFARLPNSRRGARKVKPSFPQPSLTKAEIQSERIRILRESIPRLDAYEDLRSAGQLLVHACRRFMGGGNVELVSQFGWSVEENDPLLSKRTNLPNYRGSPLIKWRRYEFMVLELQHLIPRSNNILTLKTFGDSLLFAARQAYHYASLVPTEEESGAVIFSEEEVNFLLEFDEWVKRPR